MSADATFWAWKQAGLKSSHKFVLLCLGDCHNADSGRCDPSVAFISNRTGLDRKTVILSLETLEKVGLISIEKRAGGSSVFALDLSQIRDNPKTAYPKNGITQKRDNHLSQKRDGGYPKNGMGGIPNLGHEPTNNLQITSSKTISEETEKPETPKIEFQKIVDLYNEKLGNELRAVRDLTDQRKKHIRARIADNPAKRSDLTWWERFFDFVAASDFLMGRGPPDDRGKIWQADFDWLLNPNNMTKILERKYHHAD